jgi:succinoglycan biosynthesis transport protein ExoP
MNTQLNEQLNLNNALRIIEQKKWLIFFCLLGILSPIIVFNRLSRPLYKADTSIVFEEQNYSASVNPPETPSNKGFINNQIEKIKSRSLSEEVARALPINIINTFPLPKEPESNFNKEEYIAKEIQDRISANAVTNSDVIKIEVEAYSAIAAKIIANTIAKVFIRKNLEVRIEGTGTTKKFIEEQLVTFKSQLGNSELALKNFKEQNKVTIINKEVEEIFKRITEAEILYNQNKTNLDAAERRLSFIQNKLALERKNLVPAITKITSPWVQQLKKQLVELEVQYTILRVQNYAESHPKLQKLKEQIEQTKDNLKQESLKIASGENIVDPISQIQKFMEESIALEIQIQTYQSQEKALREILNNYKRSLNTLPAKETQLAQLLRDKEVNEKIYMMLLQKREEAKIANAEKLASIRIIDPAKLPSKPVKPRKGLNLIFGITLGLIMGFVLVFLSEYLDNSLKTVEEAELITELNVLGTIPQISTSLKKAIAKKLKKKRGEQAAEMISNLVTIFIPKSPESQAFRTLRTNLQLSRIVTSLKTILITSANPREGKSLIAANLSITTAQMGQKTLLIDADLKRPTLHLLFQRRREPGLINVLASNNNLPYNRKNLKPLGDNKNMFNSYDIDVDNQRNQTGIDLDYVFKIQNSANSINRKHTGLKTSIRDAIYSTDVANLDLLTCGAIPNNPSEIFVSMAMKSMILELRDHYDVIFIDTLPINIFTDAALLSSIVDGSILIAKAGTSSVKEILGAKELLLKAQSKIIGLVVNYLDATTDHSKYYYYFSNNNNGSSKKHF